MEELDIEVLITAVEERPVIWDKTLEDFKDRYKTKSAWDEICAIVFKDFHQLSETEKAEKGKIVTSKWNNVRDSYVKSTKKRNIPGSAAKRPRKYIFHDLLKFLDKVIEHRHTFSNLLKAEDDQFETVLVDEDLNSTDDLELLISDASSQAVPGTSQNDTILCDFEKRLNDILDKSNVATTPIVSEDKLFFESLVPTVEKFDDEQKLEFRLELLQLIKRIKGRQYAST